jgi:two-component sensor histidine kinase
VNVVLRNDGEELEVQVHDNGIGWPEDFSIDRSDSLGLSIVRSLVTSQLGGTLSQSNHSGAVAELRIPLRELPER